MPKPKSPIFQSSESLEIPIAKDQPEYVTIPALCSSDGNVLTRWEFTPEERAAIANGADLFLAVWKGNRFTPLQPILLTIPNNEQEALMLGASLGVI